tara:strand:- start:364 stop:744 length:381 start_codon:yes stop_codon:yes gene_type:complete
MKITKQQLRQLIREGLLKENHGIGMIAQTKGAPIPLKSLASPEFAAAIKGRKMNEVVASDTAEELKDELGGLRDTLQEVRDYCERGNMDFDLDAQTRVAANMDQVLDIMEEIMGILNDEIASEEKV